MQSIEPCKCSEVHLCFAEQRVKNDLVMRKVLILILIVLFSSLTAIHTERAKECMMGIQINIAGKQRWL